MFTWSYYAAFANHAMPIHLTNPKHRSVRSATSLNYISQTERHASHERQLLSGGFQQCDEELEALIKGAVNSFFINY